MQLGHGRPDQPEHGFEVVAVQAGSGEFGGGGRADGVVDALRVSDQPFPSGVTREEPTGESLDAVALDRQATIAMDSAVDTTAPRMALFAALTMASTFCLVMSPRTAVMTGTHRHTVRRASHYRRSWGHHQAER